MIRVLFHFFLKGKKFTATSSLKAFFIFFILVWYGVAGFLYFELPLKPDLKWHDALWWTLVTMTTVGYGDFFPVSAAGRYLIGIPIMIFGIGLLGFILSETATRFIENKSRRLKGMANIVFKNHLVIVNYTTLEKTLDLVREISGDDKTKDIKIVIIDEELSELPVQLQEMDISFVKGDPSKADVLERANIQDASYAIILAQNASDSHSDNLTLAVTLMIEDINSKVITIAECVDPERKDHLKAAGCDSIICLSAFSVSLITQELQDSGVQEVITEITSNAFGNQIYLVPVQKMQNWSYQELREWSVNNKMTLLGIQRENKNYLNAESSFTLKESDQAILLGETRPLAINI